MASAPQPPQPHRWAVTGQEEEPALNDDGTPTTLHTVHFKTNAGHQSHVMVRDEEYTAANVARMIASKADRLLEVHALNSTNAPHE